MNKPINGICYTHSLLAESYLKRIKKMDECDIRFIETGLSEMRIRQSRNAFDKLKKRAPERKKPIK